MKRDPEKLLRWKMKRKQSIRKKSKPKRSLQNVAYSLAREKFLDTHTTCPVTGDIATQIHHSAKREGRWLNLQRYWIAVSAEGHEYIESHKKWAESRRLMVRINEDASTHIRNLEEKNISLFDPLFYQHWDGYTILL